MMLYYAMLAQPVSLFQLLVCEMLCRVITDLLLVVLSEHFESKCSGFRHNPGEACGSRSEG